MIAELIVAWYRQLTNKIKKQMLPLKKFIFLVKKLEKRPFEFQTISTKQEILTKGKLASEQLKKPFEKRHLTKSHVYKILTNIESCFSYTSFDEVFFIQNLNNLLDSYKLSSTYKEHKEFLDELGNQINITKKKILVYHIGLESLDERSQKMTPEEKEKSDTETIQKIGIFYILEYTIYILSILNTLTEDQRKKLFYEGLETKEANLPPYTDFRESFRKDLCLKIFNAELRNSLFEIFFTFESIFDKGELQNIYKGFKTFNLELLKLFHKEGVEIFNTIILSPFGEKIPMGELIEKINALEIK